MMSSNRLKKKKMKAYITNRIYLMLFFCSITIMAQAQQKFEISGIVQDETGQPVPGVSVYVKDKTGIGTNTDMDGKFVLKVYRGDKVQFSFIGYTRHEYLALKTEKKLVIQLVPDVSALDEVVVEAYGSKTRKITTTGAVTSVDVATLQTPATSLANMLGGRVAGIISTQGSGEPGKNISDFWIRGISTFGSATKPLIILDGVAIDANELNGLDPEIIESFSVLKDATATALYGSRGANGVMIVTTKNGKNLDKPVINFRFETALSTPTSRPETVDSVTYMQMYNESVLTRGTGQIPYTQAKIDGTRAGSNKYIYPDVDWYDEMFKNLAVNENFNFNIRGGSSRVDYYKQLLSVEKDDYAVYAESKFPQKNRKILIGSEASTKYTQRGTEMYRKIAEYLRITVDGKNGNYIAFFPSYQFMEDVLEEFEKRSSGVELVIQSQFMSENQREEFLEMFEEERDHPMLGFCVMGGVFSEGIDLTHDRLIGVIVVGTGIPQVCNDREIVKNYFDQRGMRGFDYAYLYPGMNKVLQSAGRVIRTEDDRGIILLLDDRFQNRQYQQLFPREWKEYEVCGRKEIKEKMEEFWKNR